MKSNKFPVIDFRNGRYQGQTLNQLPNGIGFFIDKNFMFCFGEWTAGEMKGNAIVIYPSGRVFYGDINYKLAENLHAYQLAEDHVQLITHTKPSRRDNQAEILVAILPLLRIILEIDNTDRSKARILREYEYSLTSQEQNLSTIAKILNLDKSGARGLISYKNFIQFFKDKFLKVYPEILQFLIWESKGKKEYFIGLRGEGLGIKIQPIDDLTLNMKKTGKVYLVRALGYFSKQNQLKDLGLKVHDNLMKGVIHEEGNFSIPSTIVRYEPGKRPLNCSVNFHNYIKRSLFYRDKVLDTQYLYDLQKFVFGFNENLRKVETERLAQQIIENPNSDGGMLAALERKRREKERPIQTLYKQQQILPQNPNPYNPVLARVAHPQYNLQKVKEEIYRSANKKKNVPRRMKEEYNSIQYQDPNYRKINRDQITSNTGQNIIPNKTFDKSIIGQSIWPTTPINNRTLSPYNRSISPYNRPISPSHRPISPLNRSISRLNHPNPTSKSKAPYQYLYDIQVQDRPNQRKRKWQTAQRERKTSYINDNFLNDENNYRSPPAKPFHMVPQSEQPIYKRFLEDQTNISNYRYREKPKYNSKFDGDDEGPRASPIKSYRP